MADQAELPIPAPAPAEAPAAPADAGPIAKPELTAEKPDTPLSVSDAARALSKWRRQTPKAPRQPTTSPTERAEEAAPPAQEPADEAGAAPPSAEATGEDQGSDPAREPPLDLPRSWARDHADAWANLDRDTQQYLLERDRQDSDAVKRTQNETAAERKALEAERQRYEQSRQQYDQALPALLSTLQTKLAGDFADIQSMADVHKMAKEDWGRYMQWDAQQKEIAAVSAEVDGNQRRQAMEAQTAFAKYAEEQDRGFIAAAPEFADSEKASKLKDSAVALLKELGFGDAEISRYWTGQDFLSLRDKRIQLLIRDGVRYREAHQAARKVASKPLPPVQRPGVAQPSANLDQQVAAAQKRFNTATGSMAQRDAGVELMRLKRLASQGRNR